MLYCEGCKKAYAKHQATCKRWQTRRSFYRVASTLQKIFYMYRKYTFDRHILKVDKSGKQIIVAEAGAKLKDDVVTASDWMVEFPATLFAHNKPESRQMELSLLADDGVAVAVAWMYNIIDYMLKSRFYTLPST